MLILIYYKKEKRFVALKALEKIKNYKEKTFFQIIPIPMKY